MRDRWDEEDELDRGRDRLREREREREPTLSETIDGAVRKIVTGLVIAGALIGLGVYSSGGGGDPSVDFQIATTQDRKVYRLSSDTERILACEGQQCCPLPTDRDDLDEGPPASEAPKQNAAAPPTQPQAVTTQPTQAQLPAPQNGAVPAAR
jgi:hypothetical protein